MSTKNIVVLLTPFHTGTHFVRMLLETHPKVGTAIAEDFRVDPLFRPDFVIAGRGKGWIDDLVQPERDHERGRMVGDYFEDYLIGGITKEEFYSVLRFRQSQVSEFTKPLRAKEHEYLWARNIFKSFGIELPSKDEQFLLFRCHYREAFSKCDLGRLDAFHTIVTIRHSLRTILSILRRAPISDHESLVRLYLSTLPIVLSLPRALVFCTDLWQSAPELMESPFKLLGLDPVEETHEYIARRPAINQTVGKGESHGQYEYCYEFSHPSGFLNVLVEARELLDSHLVHPVLLPYWNAFRESQMSSLIERLGYNIDFQVGTSD